MSGPIQQIQDYTLGAGVVTSPLWLQVLERGFGYTVAVLGAILVIMRLWLTWQDVKARRALKRTEADISRSREQ